MFHNIEDMIIKSNERKKQLLKQKELKKQKNINNNNIQNNIKKNEDMKLSNIYIEKIIYFLKNLNFKKINNSYYIFNIYNIFILINCIILNIIFDPFNYYIQHSIFFNFNNWTFFMGIDGISIYFLYLSSLLFFLCTIINSIYVKNNNMEFIFLLTISNITLYFLFKTLDFFFFYFFFEVILIPFFIFFCYYSHGLRKYHAAYIFFFFTLVGSLFMLLFIIFFILRIGTTDYNSLINYKLNYSEDIVLGTFLFISLLFKIPTFPVHIWLPEAHVEAPTEGSIILAGILLKLSSYAFLRYYFTIFTYSNYYCLPIYNVLFIISIIYICLITTRQLDVKRIIAYSSIFHMNISFIALFIDNYFSQLSFYYMMVSHAYVSAGMFLAIGSLYFRTKEKHIFLFGEIISTMPIFTFFFFFFILANIGFPGTSGFIAEWLMFLGFTYAHKINFLIYTAITAFISTSYNIILFSRITLSINNKNKNTLKKDLNKIEIYIYSIILFHIFLLGLYPYSLLQYISFSLNIIFLNV